MATAVAEPLRSVESLEAEEYEERRAAEISEQRGENDAASVFSERADTVRERIERLKAEAGDATDPSDPAADAVAAERRDEETANLAPEDIIVAGIEMSHVDFGGKKPDTGKLTLTGASAELQEGTALPKGTMLSGRFVAIVDDVGSKDTRDKETQQVTDCVARYKAVVTDLVLDPIE